MQTNKKMLFLAVGAALVAGLHAATPKYVFMFIGDGMGMPQRMVAEDFSRRTGRGPLAMNALPYQGLTRTASANQLITDSAAAATSIACGVKANNSALGVTPDGRRVESVAELAKRKGMKVGIITTVTIVHATPAAFYAHRKNRGESYRIALDLVDSGFDFFAGGGVYNKYDDTRDSEYRGNVFDVARKAGYSVVRERGPFLALKPGAGKVWGVFADEGLDFDIDDRHVFPTLKEMVVKGVELLDGPGGFFMMAEGGRVDYAAHANDAATTVKDIIAMDDAVKVACAFAERHPGETLILVTGDHETGGLAMGYVGTGSKFHIHLLARQKCSTESFMKRIHGMLVENIDLPFEAVKPLVTENFGLIFDRADAKTADDRLLVLSAAEIKELEDAYAADVAFVKAKKQETRKHDVRRRQKFAATAKRLLGNHVGVGWSSGAHTAMPTTTTAQGCGAERFIGLMENSDIGLRLKEILR